MNFWFWTAVFHSRDVELTEKLNYSSAVALLGFTFILSLLRAFSVRDEAARVMVAAPFIAFELDYGLNLKVCLAMGVAELLTWAVWGGVTRHSSRWKLWGVVVGEGLAMILELYDFPPYQGFVDAHALYHAASIPLTYLWWSFIRDDAEFRTSTLLKKVKSCCFTFLFLMAHHLLEYMEYTVVTVFKFIGFYGVRWIGISIASQGKRLLPIAFGLDTILLDFTLLSPINTCIHSACELEHLVTISGLVLGPLTFYLLFANYNPRTLSK